MGKRHLKNARTGAGQRNWPAQGDGLAGAGQRNWPARVVAAMVAGICWWQAPVMAQTKVPEADREELDKALDYFTSAKYHEALLIFQDLDRRYKLNPRYHAYMGLCFYHDWEYADAIRQLEPALPQLSALSPQELSVYFYATAESHFNLGEYAKAIPLYEQHLLVCQPNERADALYRIGFAYHFMDNEPLAGEYFAAALCCYERLSPTQTARIAQLRKMVKALATD